MAAYRQWWISRSWSAKRGERMNLFAGLVVDHHILAGISVAALMLGVLGSLYLSYDLLGRNNGVLRGLIRVSTPGFLGAIILAPMGILDYAYRFSYVTPLHDTQLYLEVLLQGAILFA